MTFEEFQKKHNQFATPEKDRQFPAPTPFGSGGFEQFQLKYGITAPPRETPSIQELAAPEMIEPTDPTTPEPIERVIPVQPRREPPARLPFMERQGLIQEILRPFYNIGRIS